MILEYCIVTAVERDLAYLGGQTAFAMYPRGKKDMDNVVIH